MTNLPPNVSEVANWIIYMNVGAVLFLAVGSPILITLIRRWINNLVSTEFCQLAQSRCKEKMATDLADKFLLVREWSKEEDRMIYKEIKDNRELSMKEFGDIRKDINTSMTNMTNLLVSHIQKNGG